MKCDLETVEALVLGGAVLGGGGGGNPEEGLRLGRLALELGTPRIVPLKELEPSSTVVTVSAVGAPAAAEKYVRAMDYVRTVEMVAEALGRSIAGLITNEMGGLASVNGLIQSAVLDIPVVDAPCNGRAHPLAAMGALGLENDPDYVSIQAARGGNPDRGRRVELLVRGSLSRCNALVREASVHAGGIVAVARNPVTASYLETHAALGAMQMAISLGRSLMEAREQGRPLAEAIVRELGGKIVTEGQVEAAELVTRGGFDIGNLRIQDGFEIIFWNEYMLLERTGTRLFTFPDLIVLVEREENRPLSSAEVRVGMEVTVVGVPKENLVLGAGMHNPELFRQVEEAIGKPMIPYIFREE